MGVLVTSCKWKPGHNRLEMAFSFYYVGLGNRTQTVKLAGHLTGSGFIFLYIHSFSSLEMQS